MSRGWMLDTREADDPKLDEQLGRGLHEFAEELGVPFIRCPLAITARDGADGLLGGLTGEYRYNWLYLSRLWVAKAWRRRGLGAALLNAAEDHARQRDAAGLYLCTYGQDALRFYHARGCETFAELPDPDPQRTRFFLRKTLRWRLGASDGM